MSKITRLDGETLQTSVESAGLQTHLKNEIEAHFGAAQRKPIGYFIKSESGELRAGLQGVVHWNWFYISHLWVREDARKDGLASKLIEACLAEAKRAGLQGVYVDTFDAKVAVKLYEKHGFTRFGQVPDFPPGFQRTFLAKTLS